MSSEIGALRVVLGVDTAQFTKGLAKAGAQMRAVGRNLSLGVSAPLAGFAGLAVKVGGDFEASMNRVGAATGAGVDDLAALRESARDLGSTTQFSATEAANAIEVLAKNGLGASEILGGALSSSLLLAASSGADLASSGDIATDVMLQFKKGAGDLEGVVDGITGTLLASKFGIDDYRLALGQAGGVAGGLGVEFEDFNAALAATSSRFASGSDAGTSFKTFIQRLVPQTKQAAAIMEDLNLSFFNAEGEMNSVAEIAETLKTSLGGLSEEAKNEALKTLFGTDALRTAIGLMDAGAEGIDRISASIDEASAQEQAAARMEGFNGAIKEMSSAFESLQIAIAESGLLDFITDLVKGAAELLRKAGDLDPKLLKMGTVFAGVAAAIGPAVIALGLVLTAVAAISAPVVLAAAGVTALTAGLVAFWPEVKVAAAAVGEFVKRVAEFVSDFPDTMLAIFAALPGQMAQIGRDILSGLWSGLTERFEGIKTGLTDFAGGMVTSIKERLGIQSPSTVFKEIGVNIMEGLGIGLETTGEQVEAKMGTITDSLSSSISGMFKGVLIQGKSFKDALADMLGGLATSVGTKSIDSLVQIGFDKLPEFANGTNYAPGGLAMVGERGPELVNLPRGSQVVPNHKMGGGNGVVEVVLVTADNVTIGEVRQISGETSVRVSARTASAQRAALPSELSNISNRFR